MNGLKILIVNDFASNASLFEKYLPCKVDVIYFDKHEVITSSTNPLFFEKKQFTYQIKKIKKLSDKYDLFLCFGWLAAAICYLANVNYIMYFVDVYIEPEQRIRKKMSYLKRKLLLDLYKETLACAKIVVSAHKFHTMPLKKYRKDVKEIFPYVDFEMFDGNAKKINLNQEKFIFFSPQRLEKIKGQHLLWEAIKLAKSDFVVLQTDWGSKEYLEEISKNKPECVRLIPKIKREDMASYYVSVDALLGCISPAYAPGIEREAILSKIPVFCYAPIGFTNNDPFYTKSKDPKDIADYIDRMVTDKEFRNNLISEQSTWIKNTFDSHKLSEQWMDVFNEALTNTNHYKTKIKFKIIYKILKFFGN